MIDVAYRKCQFQDCKSIPNYNIEGMFIGILCNKHKEEGMVDVIHKKCESTGCYKRPNYGIKGTKTAIFCKNHKENGMVDVSHKLCIFEGCETRASYTKPGEKKILFCALHKDEEMENHNKKCQNTGCNTIGNFNYPNQEKGMFCVSHKLLNMIDVKNIKCHCNKRAWYGIPGLQVKSCAEHRTENMIKYPRTRCIHKACNDMAIYGYNLPLHCETHKRDDEYNLVERKCVSCNLLNVLDNTNHCSDCGDFKFRRVHLAKQKEVKAFLDTSKIIYESYYRIIDSTCGLERPDFIIECKTHKIILEVDENQHKSYNADCEKARMINISQSLGMPVIFVRYNPDTFKKTVKFNKRITKQYRKELMLEWLKHCFLLSPKNGDEFLRVVYLFFDNFNPENITIDNIIIY